jgi:hypothetical protein
MIPQRDKICDNFQLFWLLSIFLGALMKQFLIGTAICLAAGTSLAHHGSAGQFDHSKTIEVTGAVTKIRFVNPHSYVYFDVTNDDGSVDEWRCEMRAASVLKRSGWSKDMFEPGTIIDIVGVPARREPHGCYVETLALNEGETIERYAELEGADKGSVERALRLDDGTPNLAGNWVAPPRNLGGPPRGPGGPGAQPGNPPGTGGPGGPGRRGGPPRYAQSDAGIAASANFKTEDNPRYQCMATNIFMDWTFDQHVNTIEQNENSITLTYGFMNIVRTIHVDQDAHPDDLEPSRAGHSYGKWDGDTLVVDTIGFAEGYLDGRSGIKHSDQLHVVEKFSRGEDGKSLIRTWVGEDPAYLSAPFEGRNQVLATEAEFDPYNCEDLTQEIVEGF